jgi:hypothetical protein
MSLPTYPSPFVILITDGNDNAAGVLTGGSLRTTLGGRTTGTVATGAGNTVVSASAGRIARVLVAAAGTGTGNVVFYDNATTNSGNIVGVVPATVAIGTTYLFDMPVTNGIVAVNVADGPALTVSYD